ncbi:hypothetical protein Tco_0827080, partial [Tanacetum coccineum]
MPLEDDALPAKEQPLPAAASPTTESPGYVPESDPEKDPEEDDEEDPEEDPADYPANRGDDGDDEESSDDDDDDDEDEKEEHLAPTNPAAVAFLVDQDLSDEETEPFETDESVATPPSPSHPTYCVTARMSIRPQAPAPFLSEEVAERLLALPTPPLSPLSPDALPSPVHETEILEICLPLRKRSCRTAPTPGYEVGESSAVGAARQDGPAIAGADLYAFVDMVDATLGRQMSSELDYVSRRQQGPDNIPAQPRPVTGKMASKRRTTRSTPVTTTPSPVTDTPTTTSVTNAQLQAMIDQGVTAVLAARDAIRNGDDSHTSGTCVKRNEHLVEVNDNGRRPGKKEETSALMTLDNDGIDWSGHAKDEDDDFAIMAINNANTERDQLSDAHVEILAYSQGLKMVEAQLATHQSNQLWYEQKIRYMKIDLDDKTDVLTYHKKLLADALKEKGDLKTKVDKWHNSSKNLSKLLNTQMSANDKFRLGYGDYRFDGILSYENEVLQSVFFNKDNNTDDSTLNDRFATTNEMHVIPPPMTGNYMPSRPDVEIDKSQYSYGPKTTQSSETATRTSEFDSCKSNLNEDTPDSMPLPVASEQPVVSTPKVWTDAPIIEEYESDDECQITPSSDQDSPRENIKDHNTCSQNPKVNQKNLNGSKSTRIGLGYGNNRRGCYVCGSFSYLIRDCDFHEKRMGKQAAMNKNMSKSVNQKENRPNKNNVHKVTHVNQFVPSAVLTRSGKITINSARSSCTNNFNTARQKVSIARQNCPAVPTRTARQVSTKSTKVNNIKPNHVFNNVHSPSKRPFSRTTATRTKFSNPKVSTARGKAVSAIGGNVKTAVKASADYIWRPKRYYDDPQRALKNKGIVDSGCSLHMTGNKGYLVDYQDFNGGPVGFGGSKGQITGK